MTLITQVIFKFKEISYGKWHTFEVKNNFQHLYFITVKFNYIWVRGQLGPEALENPGLVRNILLSVTYNMQYGPASNCKQCSASLGRGHHHEADNGTAVPHGFSWSDCHWCAQFKPCLFLTHSVTWTTSESFRFNMFCVALFAETTVNNAEKMSIEPAKNRNFTFTFTQIN